MKKTKNNKKKYSHISQFERDRIDAMLNNGYTQKDIAIVLKRNKGTISREIKRNRRKIRKKGGTIDGKYESSVANHKAYLKRKYSRCNWKKINKDINLESYILRGLKKHWSPDEISGKMKKDKELFYASKTAIYEWLYSNRAKEHRKYLTYKRNKPKKRKKKKTKRTLIPNRIGIEMRPKVVNTNKEYGHHETDTIVSGKKTKSKASLVVDYEKRSKYVSIRKIKSLKPKIFNLAVMDIDSKFVKIKTRTMDNGIENKFWEELGVDTYFCNPYSSWEKGGVENVNGMIRNFVPKGCDISKISLSYIKMVQDIINNKPRKSLGYRTPKEVMISNNLLKK